MRTEEERLASYRAAFLEKVKKWKWDEPEVCSSKPRGRKPKPMVKFESKPRTEGERRAALAASNQSKSKQSKYNWL
jgi:hypothetical protein